MEPRQRSFLIWVVLATVLVAGLFRFVVKPIVEEPERKKEEQAVQRAEKQAKERMSALVEARDLMLEARTKWREAVATAQAGAASSVPPLIDVQRNDSGDFVFTNISGQALCFSVARVALPARCDLGQPERCQPMAPGEKIEFNLDGRRDEQACRSQTLEYRIGRPVSSDLPWWSDSALEDFDRVTGLMEAELDRAIKGVGVGATDNLQTGQLRAENKSYKEFVAEADPAEGWRQVLEPLRKIQLDMMAAREGNVSPEAKID